MNISEHATILKSYIDRLSLRDLKFIALAMEACWQEQVNGNGGSQRSADAQLHHAILESLGSMLNHDRDNIAAIVNRVVNRD